MIYLTSGGRAHPGRCRSRPWRRSRKPKNIPILVDAAAEVLTIPNVHLQRGATIVAYSGGKAICGPQCAGLLLGRKDLLMSAWQASAPHHGPGRDNKVGREETLGMLAAVEAWVKRDHDAEWKTWLSWLDTISKRVSTIDGVKTSVREPTGLSNKSPSLTITLGSRQAAHHRRRSGRGAGEDQAADCARRRRWRRQATPDPGHDVDFGHRLDDAAGRRQGRGGTDSRRAVARSAARESTDDAAPSANVSGRWDVDIEFFSSKSQHTLFIEQDGNWIQGSHQGDFTVRDMVGMIEGNEVKLRSVERRPGDFGHLHLRGHGVGRHHLGPDSHG